MFVRTKGSDGDKPSKLNFIANLVCIVDKVQEGEITNFVFQK